MYINVLALSGQEVGWIICGCIIGEREAKRESVFEKRKLQYFLKLREKLK